MHIILFVITIIQIVIFVVKKIFEIYGIISVDIMPVHPSERTWHYNSIT